MLSIKLRNCLQDTHYFAYIGLLMAETYCIILYYGTNRPLLWVFLGAFAKLGKSTISFVMSVRLLQRMEQIRFRYTDFL